MEELIGMGMGMGMEEGEFEESESGLTGLEKAEDVNEEERGESKGERFEEEGWVVFDDGG
jgi:hypothetical protein